MPYSRSRNYARVMLTQYPYRHWDVGDLYGADEPEEKDDKKWMEQAILAGRALVGVIRQKKLQKQGQISQEDLAPAVQFQEKEEPEKKKSPAFLIAALVMGGVAVTGAYFAFKKTKRGAQ